MREDERPVSADRRRALLFRWFGEWGDPSDASDNYETSKTPFEAFMFEACYTFIAAGAEGDPIQPMLDLPYIHLVARRLQAHRLGRFGRSPMAIPKSRKILVSWIIHCYMLWLVLRHDFRLVALVHKDADEGKMHIETRLKAAIYAHLPKWLREMYTIGEMKGWFVVTHRLGVRWASHIQPIAKGENELRQDDWTLIVYDEAAHQPLLEGSYRGGLPSVRGRGDDFGQMILVSSPEMMSYFNTALVYTRDLDRARLIAAGVQREAA